MRQRTFRNKQSQWLAGLKESGEMKKAGENE